MDKLEHDYDVVVVGGGMVGAAAALGLAHQGLSVAVLEQQLPVEYHEENQPDVRVSAIGYRAVSLLKQLDVWQYVEQMRYAPYRHLETWEWDNALLQFDSETLGLPELGMMVENQVLQNALWQGMVKEPRITLHCPVSLSALHQHADHWQVILSAGVPLRARLVLGADGANSKVRHLAGIGCDCWEYRQSCLLLTVKTEQTQQDTTWQRFYPSGPRAFLPLFDQWASLAWYDSPNRIRQLQAMTPTQLSQEVKRAFPERLGAIHVRDKASFPLVRRHAQRYVLAGLALVGDAAHTINPLAGQGVNLGYRDVESLLSAIEKARDRAECWYSESVLMRYQQQRRPDNLLMQSGMDLFYSTFSNELPPLRLARNMALMLAQRSGPLKRQALKYALGL